MIILMHPLMLNKPYAAYDFSNMFAFYLLLFFPAALLMLGLGQYWDEGMSVFSWLCHYYECYNFCGYSSFASGWYVIIQCYLLQTWQNLAKYLWLVVISSIYVSVWVSMYVSPIPQLQLRFRSYLPQFDFSRHSLTNWMPQCTPSVCSEANGSIYMLKTAAS